jgi:regulator of replication initiation timing
MGQLGPILTAVLSVTAIIATALVGLMFGSLRTLRDTANDLRARVGDLEKERAEDKAENAELASENKWLRTTVTGKVEWTVVTDQIAEHHREARQHWQADEALLREILTTLREAS